MEAILKAFLNNARVKKGESCFTHLSKSTGDLRPGWFAGSYYIDREHYEDFITIYCNMIKKGNFCTLAEKPEPFGPLRVDFDFKAKTDVGLKRQYNEEILKELVGLYQKQIKKIVPESDFNNKMLWCIVLEKKSPRLEEGLIKDGFHFHFPHFICDGWVMDVYLRDKVSSKMIENKIWEKAEFVTPISDIIDMKMASKAWMMYGSMNYKGKGSTPYMYNNYSDGEDNYGHIYDHNLEEMPISKVFEKEMIGRKNNVKYYLPRLMSIRGHARDIPLKKEIEAKRRRYNNRPLVRKTIQKTRPEEEIAEDLKTIKEGGIMEMLSDDRAENTPQWFEVGWTLYNIGQGCDEVLNMWIEFSKRCPEKFVEGECEQIWEKMEMRGKTIASLLAMAKHDSIDEFNEWKKTNVNYCIFSSLQEPKPTEYDISLVVVKLYEGRYVCADGKSNLWYEFKNHRWMECDQNVEFGNRLVGSVIQAYADYKKKINDKINDIEYKKDLLNKRDDPDEYMDINREYKKQIEQRGRCSAIISALKTISFHKKVIEMCKLKMSDRTFMRKTNENKYLLACENGVLDLELGAFRDGRPDDYITFSTGINYRTYRHDDEDVEYLYEYLNKVYVNPNIREYFIDFMASCLEGGNPDKIFLIATGDSDGAKSMTFSLLELVFGTGEDGYSGKFPRELVVLSGKASSSGPRPELSRVRGKRVMSTQEVTKKEKMNIPFIKESTGNDSFWARGMWEKGTEIKPQYKLLTQCNVPPSADIDDEAFWSRIRILDHESKFVTKKNRKKWPVPKSTKEQYEMKRFKADPSFSKELPYLAPVLLWLLFERYKLNKGKGFKTPNEVIISTAKYQESNDVYMRFIAESIEKESDEELASEVSIGFTECYARFEEWYKDEFTYSSKIPAKKIFKTEMNSRLGVITKDNTLYGFGKRSRWWGYKLKNDDEDDSENFED